MSVFEFWRLFREGMQMLRVSNYVGKSPSVYVRTRDGNEHRVTAIKIRLDRMILEIDE